MKYSSDRVNDKSQYDTFDFRFLTMSRIVSLRVMVDELSMEMYDDLFT